MVQPDGGRREQELDDVRRRLLSLLTSVEDVFYLAVGLVLIGVAGAQLYHTVSDLITTSQPFITAITNAVNGVLLVVIVLELFSTVAGHLEGGGFQLRPFLIIGIISAVRHILLIGAQSLSSTSTAFDHAQIELGVSAGVAFLLVLALVLLQRSGSLTGTASDD